MVRDSNSPLSSSLRQLVATVLLLLLSGNGVSGKRTYIDAKGDVFTVEDGAPPPKIVINGYGALSLFHLGLPSSQLEAVYDHWVIRGSTLDLEDPSGEFDSDFGIDPNAEEIEYLQQAENLSPECTANSAGCFNNYGPQDLQGLDYNFVVVLRAGSAIPPSGVLNGSIDAKQNELGQKIIWIDHKYEHNTGCYGNTDDTFDLILNDENCYSKSLIDVVRELEVFAAFLGVEPTETVRDEKMAMCEAASNFVEHSDDLRARGILAAPISLRPFNGITMNWFSPISFPWLRTLEELGFPIVHPPNSVEATDMYSVTVDKWFPDCATYPICTGDDANGSLPIDLWLLDSRSYTVLDASYEDSLLMFPDKAFGAKQYSYWQFNDGAISYTNIARYLNDIVAATTDIQRVHTTTIDCAENLDVTSPEFTNLMSGGVGSVVPGSGTYACRGNLQSLYTECSDDMFSSNQSNESSSSVVTTQAPVESIPELPVPTTSTATETSSGASGNACFAASVTAALVLPIAAVWL
jgi:hypothetical protein